MADLRHRHVILMLEERMKAMATTQVSSYHWQHTASQYAAFDAGGRGVLGTSPAPERPPIWSGDVLICSSFLPALMGMLERRPTP